MTGLEQLRAAVAEATAAVGGAHADVESGGGGRDAGGARPRLERPPKADFGDYSTNAALLLAPRVGSPPREVAERLGRELERSLGDRLERVEVAGPGFLNLFLSDGWFRASLHSILTDPGFGGATVARAERIDVEFVSANPTGPLTVAHGRHAAYGDALARILGFHGHTVTREFYVNDAGSQIRRLAESVRALARGEQIPEDGYQGDYVGTLVPRERALALDLDELGREAAAACLALIRATLERFDVRFDVWFSERDLHAGADAETAVARALARLEERGDVFRSEGALWLRTSAHGDDKDRVLQRSNGEYTYFASDIAYHADKLARGLDRYVNVYGADHHGYVRRMLAAWEALGGAPGTLELLILQFVHLLDRGARASMSKRRGEYVTLDELIDEIGADATRYFLLTRSHETTVDLDLELARERSADNPVYYIQYAHARIASMLARAGAVRVAGALESVGGGASASPGVGAGAAGGGALGLAGVAGGGAVGGNGAAAGTAPLELAERTLLKRLEAFPAEVAEAAERRAPHRIAGYALELAQDFTAFYRDCRVVGAEPESVESFRIALSVAAQRTIARALDLLGVSAPEQM